ncbi:hypothetical protein [Jiangella sp. DSM 45060]|uniref:hypothetical protein n=1 Tax=Jiangella sp. DSM 45060 TaxID=1798224 RepID=UPI0012FD91F0|nr:hypothetical protein [Jiangella sp. DSM 45060]
MDSELLDQLLPVATFALGLASSKVDKRGELRRQAATEMAGLRRIMWMPTNVESGWPEADAELGRLCATLRSAGVPQFMVASLRTTMESIWQATEYIDEEVGHVVPDRALTDRLKALEAAVLDYLDPPWHQLRRRRARRSAKLAIEG